MNRKTLIATLFALALPLAAAAQDTPVVFVHGLAADQNTWMATALRLQQQLSIRPYLGKLPWRETFEVQASVLQSQFGSLPASTIAVGHSNGGLVSRQWSFTHPLHGLLTVGTPNAGAPLVNNLLGLISFNQSLYYLFGMAGSAFGVQPNEWSPIFMYVYAALVLGQQLSVQTIASLALSLGLQAGIPVLPEMSTSSYFISQINAAANIAREQSVIAGRVGLVYVARNYRYMGPARAIDPDNADRFYNEMWAAIGTLEAAAAFLWTNYPYNSTANWIANALWQAAGGLRGVDPAWCGAVTNDSSCNTWHDGVVPTQNQLLPGGVNLLVNGPAHIQETKVAEPVSFALTGYLGVSLRGSGSLPPAGSGGGDVLASGQTLFAGESRTSGDGRFQLAYQGDGNLVLYRMTDGAALWSTATYAPGGEADMQTDGNLVVYDASGAARWNSGTVNYPGAHLVVQSDGNLVIYDYYGFPIWATGTAQ